MRRMVTTEQIKELTHIDPTKGGFKIETSEFDPQTNEFSTRGALNYGSFYLVKIHDDSWPYNITIIIEGDDNGGSTISGNFTMNDVDGTVINCFLRLNLDYETVEFVNAETDHAFAPVGTDDDTFWMEFYEL